MNKIGLYLLVLLGLSACNSPGFVYYNDNTPQVVSTNHTVTDLGTAHVDIIWQVGGMTELQATLDAGATSFMTQLSGMKNVDWKVGVLANDDTNLNGDPLPPILGFDKPFDSHSPNPVTTFEQAVDYSVGHYDGEMEMIPIQKALQQYPSFPRKNAYLLIIMSNDNQDVSACSQGGSPCISSSDFLSFLSSVKGDLSQVVAYGVIGSTDLGCNPNDIDEDWNYHGSSFEKVINGTKGQVYSLCTSNFGTSLANITTNFFSRITHPSVYLDYRPVTSSIQVTYNGEALPGGPQDSGGFWYYDYSLNAVIFYNLDFAINATSSQQVHVTYTRAD